MRVGIVTTVGPEPEAQAGLVRARDLAAWMEASTSPASITFGHAETDAGRELVLERRGGQVPAASAEAAGAVLFAPVADEIPASGLAIGRGAMRGAILQGWLRSTAEGEPVRPQCHRRRRCRLVAALGALDLVIGCSEDLRPTVPTPWPSCRPSGPR